MKRSNFLQQENIKERESVKYSQEDIKMMLALIDLLFLIEDESKVIPS